MCGTWFRSTAMDDARARQWLVRVADEVTDERTQHWLVRLAVQQRDEPREWLC